MRRAAFQYLTSELENVVGAYEPLPVYVVQGGWDAGEYCHPCAEKAAAKAASKGAPIDIGEIQMPVDIEWNHPLYCSTCGHQLQYLLSSAGAEEILDGYIDGDIRMRVPINCEEAYDILAIMKALAHKGGVPWSTSDEDYSGEHFKNVITLGTLAVEAIRPPEIQLDLFEEQAHAKTDVVPDQRKGWSTYEFI